MSRVLCITRGGDGGIRAQDEAIALAKGQDECLVFLHVLDTSFLNKIVGGNIKRLAQEEMVKLGEFTLAMAVERAMSEGVQAKAIVRPACWARSCPRLCANWRQRRLISRASVVKHASLMKQIWRIFWRRPNRERKMIELRNIGDCMKRHVVFVRPDTTIGEAVRFLYSYCQTLISSRTLEL